MKKDFVVLVNEQGRRTGIAEKLEAHRQGLFHRAFSIFLFNEKGEMLLQKRAAGKYHFAGLWSNACCSHPRPGEKISAAAKRRLREELNIETSLIPKGSITYKFFDSKSKLTEHEYDCIFVGTFNDVIDFNKEEVSAVKWTSLSKLKIEMKAKSKTFTPWFLEIMRRLSDSSLFQLK